MTAVVSFAALWAAMWIGTAVIFDLDNDGAPSEYDTFAGVLITIGLAVGLFLFGFLFGWFAGAGGEGR